MATMATERTLRIITIALFIPALVLCVASGIKTEKTKQGWMGSRPPVSYFGTVPAFLSALTSAVVLYANRSKSLRLGDDARAKTQRAVMLVIDVILAAGYIALLVPLWILDAGIVRWNGVAAMLLAYATMPLLINLLIHTYLATADLIPMVTQTFMVILRKLLVSSNESTQCPHCQHHRREWASGKNGYSLLRADDPDMDQAENSENSLSAEV